MYKKSLIEKVLLKLYYIFAASYFRLLHGIKVGKGCRIHFSSTIRGNIEIKNNVNIGKNVNISGNVKIGEKSNIADYARLNTMPNGKIEIGKDAHINIYNIIGSSHSVKIGDHALFAAGVKITDATHGIEDIEDIIKQAPIDSEELVIGDNCWLGFDVNVIMGGAIGKNCVIGSKSLVNKKIPANSIAVGIPAKVIGERGSIEE